MYWFNCDVCKHDFATTADKVSGSEKRWCHYCCQKLCDKIDDCKWCFDHSFASSLFAKYWDISVNKIIPRMIRKSSNKKFAFICENDHHIEIRLGNITHGGKWCGFCFRKTEEKLHTYLLEFYSDIKPHAKFDWCINPKSGRNLIYDFYIPSLNLILEIDGPQHFSVVSNWGSPEQVLVRDVYKMKMAIDNNISIVRILQTDIWMDKNDWKTQLSKHLVKNIDPSVTYIDNATDIYDGHKNGMQLPSSLENMIDADSDSDLDSDSDSDSDSDLIESDIDSDQFENESDLSENIIIKKKVNIVKKIHNLIEDVADPSITVKKKIIIIKK